MIDLRRLLRSEAAAYRALMLASYAASPEAFTSAPGERDGLPLAWWEQRIDHGAFGAFVEGTLVGAAALQRETRPRLMHKATLVGMYVEPAHRRAGVGEGLVKLVLEAARAQGVSVVQLTFTEGNDAAGRLYARCGFISWGTEPMAVRLGERFVGKVQMYCPLAPGPQNPSPALT